jgi:hypothetical protein
LMTHGASLALIVVVIQNLLSCSDKGRLQEGGTLSEEWTCNLTYLTAFV